MLQQTQVGTVIGYYERFLARFPDIASIARADLDAVMSLWSGLGYYSRARNLHKAARIIQSEHGGCMPGNRADIEALPGIGRSTAAAIAVFAHGAREAILDGNVKRVLARHRAVSGYTGSASVQARLWSLAEDLLPAQDIAAYTQGLMDLGATLCTRTNSVCGRCPVRDDCIALATQQVHAYPSPPPPPPVAPPPPRPRERPFYRGTARTLSLGACRGFAEQRVALLSGEQSRLAGMWGCGSRTRPPRACAPVRHRRRASCRAAPRTRAAALCQAHQRRVYRGYRPVRHAVR